MLIANRLQGLNQLQQYLLGSGGLDGKLTKITEGVVEIFNADFCRIWIKGPGDLCEKGCIHAKAKDPEKVCRLREYCLHLVASSGRYTHIDGPHSRMPFGLYKLGRIATGKITKFLANDAVNDPQIMDHEWVKGLGLVSFAGYKLQDTTGGPIGVLALFSKQSITTEEDAMLECLAGITAHVIQTMKAEGALKVERDKLINILESMGDGVYIGSQTYDIEYINPVIEREFGPINGRKCYEYFHDRDEVCPWCKSKEAFAGKTVRREWYSAKNNKTYDLLETPLRNRDGTISKLEIFRDITERKYAEDALEARANQLIAVTGAICSFLESRNWQKTSAMILSSALAQTESEYGFIGVAVDLKNGPALRIFAIEGIDWDKNINSELYEGAMHSFREQGYIDLPNLDNLFGRVITTGNVIISDDPGKDQRSGGRLPAGHPDLLSFLGVPIFKKGLDPIGMIGVANRPGGYSGEEQSRIEILCHVTSILYDNYLRHQKEAAYEEERKKQEEAIHHLAYYDMLTNLPNRLSLHDDIDRAISQARTENSPLALLIINLDRFEEINNTLGHDNGDLILQQIAIRLQGISGEPNRVARLGGDIFAALLHRTDAGGAAKKAGKIIGIIKAPLSIADLSIEVSACIGISLFPGHGADADTLIRRAEIAMFVAKKIESSLCIYSPKYDQYSQSRLALMGELRQAIEQDQLFLLYQPKIDLKTGKTIGVEALCRWQHPKSGVIPPNDFIHLAERGGMIKELTLWVIKEVMRQSRIWYKGGLEVSLAVNLSVRSLQNPHLLDKIKGLISTWGITPSSIRFEITESIIMQNPELAMETITELTSLGIKFSIDDFGTGYSSLSYLQRLPVDEIKIDKSFVINMGTDENSAMIVRSVIELAHNLGLKVTAEGVENKDAMDKLISLGCDQAQGYLISPPIAQEEIAGWLRK